MIKYTVGSLFSGIGGLELGLEMTGSFETLWQSEIDEYCQALLAKRWPESINYGDIKDMRDEIKRVDVVCGGFPCQDISKSGRKAGIKGERSSLFYEATRIVKEIRPKAVVLENVSALLRNGMREVAEELTGIGYNMEWKVISGRDVGACHERKRVFIIAYSNGIRLPRPWTLGEPMRAEEGDYREASGIIDAFQRKSLPYVCGRHDGVPKGVAESRLKALGNAVIPQVSRLVGIRLSEVLDSNLNKEVTK